jgi:hypothetical protein
MRCAAPYFGAMRRCATANLGDADNVYVSGIGDCYSARVIVPSNQSFVSWPSGEIHSRATIELVMLRAADAERIAQRKNAVKSREK